MKTLSWRDKDGEGFEIIHQDTPKSEDGSIMAIIKVEPSKARAARGRPPSGVYITRAQARELVGWLRLVLDEA